MAQWKICGTVGCPNLSGRTWYAPLVMWPLRFSLLFTIRHHRVSAGSSWHQKTKHHPTSVVDPPDSPALSNSEKQGAHFFPSPRPMMSRLVPFTKSSRWAKGAWDGRDHPAHIVGHYRNCYCYWMFLDSTNTNTVSTRLNVLTLRSNLLAASFTRHRPQ